MKSFKEYLVESKSVYEFKVKVAGDAEGASKLIKQGLSAFGVESCSSGKRLPIAETHSEFPQHKNINVTMFDVKLSYPANGLQVKQAICNALNKTDGEVIVRTMKEDQEVDINHQHDKASGESLLAKDYETGDNQKLVGEKQKMALLKELNKTKVGLTQYKGVNDDLLANNAPASKDGPAAAAFKANNVSPVGSKAVKKPTAKTVGRK